MVKFTYSNINMSESIEDTDSILARQISDTSLCSTDVSDTTHHSKNDKQKIDVLLKAAGNAPIMKKKKWAVDAEQNIGWIGQFIKRYLKLEPSEQLFLYINQTFAPSPDQIVKNLYDCYGSDGKLVLHYCKTQAWG